MLLFTQVLNQSKTLAKHTYLRVFCKISSNEHLGINRTQVFYEPYVQA